MRKYPIIGTFMCLLMFFGGCGATYRVQVDSISASNSSNMRSYVLLPGNDDTTPSDLQFMEFGKYIKHVLSSKGYVEADDFNEADLAIFLAYGIGDPQEHQYTYNLPVWGETGVSSSYTHGTLYSYGNYGTYSGTTTYTPSYGITGYTTHMGTYLTYFRFMVLDAYDMQKSRESQDLVQAWKTTVTSMGSSGDLRRVFPILAAASKDYIASNTRQKVDRTLCETDKAVVEIKTVGRTSDESP